MFPAQQLNKLIKLSLKRELSFRFENGVGLTPEFGEIRKMASRSFLPDRNGLHLSTQKDIPSTNIMEHPYNALHYY